MILDIEKLEAAGMTVQLTDGGAMIATAQMTAPMFVPMGPDGKLMLVTQRSALHRDIAAALGGAPPA